MKSQIRIGFKDVSRKIKRLAAEDRNKQPIVEMGDGYRVFDCYEIRPTQVGSWVVVHDFRTIEPEFNSLMNAMLFCMAEYAGKRDMANDLTRLDNQYYNKRFDIQNKIHLLKTHVMDDDVKRILLTKLDEDMKVSQQLKRQLQKLSDSAKYIKIKGSHYEFTRTSTER